MSSTEGFVEQAISLAKQATAFDSSGSIAAAVYYYQQSAALLTQAKAMGFNAASIDDKIKQYSERANVLDQQRGAYYLSNRIQLNIFLD